MDYKKIVPAVVDSLSKISGKPIGKICDYKIARAGYDLQKTAIIAGSVVGGAVLIAGIHKAGEVAKCAIKHGMDFELGIKKEGSNISVVNRIKK